MDRCSVKASVSKSFHDLGVDIGVQGIETMAQEHIIQELKAGYIVLIGLGY